MSVCKSLPDSKFKLYGRRGHNVLSYKYEFLTVQNFSLLDEFKKR